MKLWVQHQHHQEPSSVLEQQIEPYIISTCFPPLKLCYYRCEKADKYCPLNSCAYETVQGLDTLRQQWWICAPDTCISWMAPPKGQVCWGGDNQGMLPWLPRHMQCPSPPRAAGEHTGIVPASYDYPFLMQGQRSWSCLMCIGKLAAEDT